MELDTTKGEWYVLQAMCGQEEKARDAMVAKRDYDLRMDIDDGIGDVRVPMDKKEERDKNNKPVVRFRKRYPGYVLAQLRLLTEDGESVHSEVWELVKSIPGIIGFVGGGNNTIPTPLSDFDVSEMLRIEEETENSAPKPKVEFRVGDNVRITGQVAFMGYEGVVESVDMERQRVKVSVNIFGRSTPTELDFNSVERFDPEEAQQL